MHIRRVLARAALAGSLATVSLVAASPAGAAVHHRGGIPRATPAALAGVSAGPSRGAAPALVHGAVAIGAASPAASVAFDVVLRPRDAGALAARAAAVSQPGSPTYHHFLTTSQWRAEFAPTPATVGAVESALRAEGLTPGPLSGNGLVLGVTSSVARADSGLDTTVERYRTADGRIAIAPQGTPRVPASVAGAVEAVLGLDTLVTASAAPPVAPAGSGGRAPAATGPTACSAATSQASDTGGYTDPQLAKAYKISGLYTKGQLGAHTTVALFELDPYSSSDVATFQKCFKTAVPITAVAVDGGDGSGAGEGEAALDIETVIGLAPKAALRVYEAPSADYGKSTIDEYTKIVSDNDAQILSSSYGICEPLVNAAFPGLVSSENTVFQEAAMQGTTVFVATGDTGSAECYPNGGVEGIGLGSGSEPSGVAVDPTYRTSYVADYGTGTLTLVDDRTGTGIGQLSFGAKSGPTAVAVDTKTHQVLVTLAGVDEVAEISSASCNASKTSGCSAKVAPVGSGTDDLGGIAVDPGTATAYLPLADQGKVAAVRVAGLGVAGEESTSGSDPYAVAVDSTTHDVYVTNFKSDTVAQVAGSACDATTTSGCSATPPTTSTGEEPSAVAVDHGASRLFVADFGDSTLDVDNLQTGASVGTFQLSGFSDGLTDVALSPDGGHLLVPVHAAVLVISVATDRATAILDDTGNDPFVVASDTADAVVTEADLGDGAAVLLPLGLAVSDPSSQPYVTAVGGTDVTAIGPAPKETTWNEALNTSCDCEEGAGTGGVSADWAMPSWQKGPGVVSSYSSSAPCGAKSGYCREVPDVSASADPVNGYVIYHDGGWQTIGGTSAATPLWAAMFAVIESEHSTPQRQGLLDPRLYALGSSHASQVFNDVTVGTNDYVGTNDGTYPATSAYDMATGLGTPIATGIESLLPAP